MSVFDIDGNALQSVYDADGNELSEAFDIDGNLIFSAKYSIDNVESYYQPRTLEVTNQLNNLDQNWQSFIFVTDPHYPTNKMHSQAVALYLLSNSSASMLVLGGDYCEGNWFKSRYETWADAFRNSSDKHQIYALIGNHERFASDTAVRESLQSVYTDFISDKLGELSGNFEKAYYYKDVTPYKTRYIFLNTSDEASQTMSADQIAWVEQAVQLPDSTWSAIVIAHITVSDWGGGTLTNRQDLIDAIETCNGEIVGYICGHRHIDGIVKASDRIYELTLLCDRFASNSTTYPREEGTITENVVSVVSFNTVTKQVVVRRIGAGSDQALNYSYA